MTLQYVQPQWLMHGLVAIRKTIIVLRIFTPNLQTPVTIIAIVVEVTLAELMKIQLAAVLRFLTGVAIFIGVPPLAWHIRASNKNVPILILICWTLLQNIIKLVNSIIWYSDEELKDSWNGEYYCDIMIKLDIIGKAGQLACVVAIMRTIARMLHPKQKPLTAAQVERAKWNDFTICMFVPLMMGAMHFYVQPSRYDIYTIIGCSPIIDNSRPSFWLFFIWPPTLTSISSLYALYILYRLYRWSVNKRERTYNPAVVWRLLIMSLAILGVLLPVVIMTFVKYWQADYIPYDWGLVHGDDWNYMVKYATGNRAGFADFVSVITSVIIFGAYGVNGETWHMYRAWAEKLHLERIYQSSSELSSFTSEQLRKLRRTGNTDTERPGSDPGTELAANEITIGAHIRLKLSQIFAMFSRWGWRSRPSAKPPTRQRAVSDATVKSEKSVVSIRQRVGKILGV